MSYTERFNLVYCLNPEPYSRILEYDPARNVFGKLPESERMDDH
jgi:hypothetical protein